MTYDEPEDFDLCGVLYKSTRPQANEIMAALVDTPEWHDYALSNDRLRYGDFSATDPEAVKLVAQHISNYRAAFKVTKKVVERILGS